MHQGIFLLFFKSLYLDLSLLSHTITVTLNSEKNVTMKIVVLDGFTLNPGDLSWQGLEQLGECEIYDRTDATQVLERCADAQVIFTNKVVLDAKLLAQFPHLKYIGVTATGYNVVDTQAAKNLGITVTNTPAYGTDSVAQFVFAQLLNWAQPVAYYSDTVKQKRWAKSPDFCYYDHPMLELAGLKLGIIGYGAIGKKVAQIALGFGMQVLTYSRTEPKSLPTGIRFVTLDELSKKSDVISLHCPLTEQNNGFINSAFLSNMKDSAYLINTGRGPLINESDLLHALKEKKIAGAALDVLAVEPPDESNPLIDVENCTITPHIAWATLAARQRLMGIAVNNLQGFMKGEAINRV